MIRSGNARRVVVTGAAGLIGQAVVRRLLATETAVVAVVRPGSLGKVPAGAEAVEIDLGDRPEERLAAVGAFDGLIHLAQAPGWHEFPKRAGSIARVNVAASVALAEAAVTAGAGCMVMASSGGVYGPSSTPIRETSPLRPGSELGFYLAAKAVTENLLSYFSQHLPVHILRPFFVYGAGQAASFLIPRLIRSIREGVPVRVDGGTGPAMNPIWVDDAAAAFVAALDRREPLVANIAGPDVVTVRDIATMAAERLGMPVAFTEGDEFPGSYVADITVMNRELGEAATPFDEGLSALIASLSLEI